MYGAIQEARDGACENTGQSPSGEKRAGAAIRYRERSSDSGAGGDTADAAERLSVNCFFNALLRETGVGTWIGDAQEAVALTVPAETELPAVVIALEGSGERLWLSVRYRSRCGRHQFGLPLVLQNSEGGCEVVGLAQAAQLVAAEASFFPQAGEEPRRRFVERTGASVRNMALALVARAGDCAQIFGAPLDFIGAEQSLLCGHSIHPTPKSREPFSDADAERYAPEFANAFALQWLAVASHRLRGASGTDNSAQDFARQLWQDDRVASAGAAPDSLVPDGFVPDGFVPVPAHPWQWRQLQTDARVAELLHRGDIVEIGEGGHPWRATSSLRAVYGAHSTQMLKFSLSLRLTNSVRTLLPKEMARGLEVPRVRATPVGREFAQRYPDFAVLAEPAYLLLEDSRGKQIDESLVMFRENPFIGDAAKNTCLLAALTQDHPQGESCRAAQLIVRHACAQRIPLAEAAHLWFTHFLDAVIEPLLIAQADYGLLFGAHQQNLILAFDGELPRAGYFRDCQGSAYSNLGESLLKPYLPDLAVDSDNVIEEEMANRLFVYYLIVNSCFGLISALCAAELLPEEDLLAQLRERLQQLHDGPRRDRSCLRYLLSAEELWAKGNFQCAVIGMNETTSDNPLSIYHKMENPLRSARG